MTDDELTRQIREGLLISPTMDVMARILADYPFDLTNPTELKACLAGNIVPLIEALDHERIHFDKVDDKLAFCTLLMLSFDRVLDGRLKSALGPRVTIQ